MASGRRLLTAAVTLMSAAAVAGCVSMPSSGPVLPYQPTQETGISEQQYLQLSSEPPGTGWSPTKIVEGFLAANGSFAGDHQVARKYLTSQAREVWGQDWSADVFKDEDVPVFHQVAKSAQTAVVTVSGSLQVSVTALGTYVYPAPTNASSGTKQVARITLTKTGGQWRISRPPSELLLSSTDFQANYQQRNLYFFAPNGGSLVADPVYVPVGAAADPEGLLTQLVKDLISQPPDWLVDATKSAIPKQGTKLVSPVSLAGGIATVSLEGAAIGRADRATDEQMAAQLLWTLVGPADSQPNVQGVELFINGKPWMPAEANTNPVLQKAAFEKYAPPTGETARSTFYYLDAKGNVWRRVGPNGPAKEILPAPAKGPHPSTIAVSPDGKYLAGLVNGFIYTAPVGGRLRSRYSSGDFTSVSWAPSDDLWAAGPGGVVVVPADGTPVPATVAVENTITALRVAPDGVRVALVVGGTAIRFGAISKMSSGNSANTTVPTIDAFSPFSVPGSAISDVTWYGPDNVIALTGSGAGSQATEYPVNGGMSIPVLSQAGMTNITASWNNPLIAGTSTGGLLYSESIGGGWGPLSFSGRSAVYPG
jgi:hypothetical protein